MRKLFTLLTLALTALSFSSQAQQIKNGKISGLVIDGNVKTIESASIQLLRSKDSSVVKMGVADKAGKFEFENLTEGKYLVAITAVGHSKGYSDAVEITAANPAVVLKTIELVPQAKSMGGVTVTAKRPPIEVKAGKMVVNVDASPTNAGLSALEVLEKSPGVSIDNDGNISLKGKQGVTILIDGKPTYMSGADLANLLKSMQSNGLDQIEIMTNPPAKYDAAGNSGIINIKTKKGIVKGSNGNATFGYTQGVYARLNAGVNFNYRNQKLNVFGGYNGGTYEGFNNLSIDRKFYEPDGITLAGTSDQESRPHFKGIYHNLKLGMDYNLTRKDILGFVVNTNINDNDEDPKSQSNIREPNGDIDYTLKSAGDNNRKFLGLTTNVNYKHTFDSTGREITADLDYAFYDNQSMTQLHSQTFDPNGYKSSDVLLNGDIPSLINIYSAKTDYVHPFNKSTKLEAGLKSSYVTTDNQVDYIRTQNGISTPDGRSNHFLYKENINAAYAIFSTTLKKWEISGGLRMENTNAKGHQYSNDSAFKRNYTNLFPNVSFGYNASDKNQYHFSYSKRIQRPNYDNLNPFIYFLDSLTYGQGNPYLQPQFTHNFEVSHTFKRFLTSTLNYTVTTDVITQMLKQDTEKKITYQTQENFASMKQLGLAVMINTPVKKWWNVNLYLNVFNNKYNGNYITQENGAYVQTPIEVQFTSFMANMTNTFTFKKGWSAEVSGWYRTKAAEGILVANDMGALNAAVTKQVMNKKGTLKLGMRDILYTQQFSGYAKYADVDVVLASKRDSRQVNLTFTYRFGKTNIAPARRKNGGAGDEQNRVGSGGGN